MPGLTGITEADGAFLAQCGEHPEWCGEGTSFEGALVLLHAHEDELHPEPPFDGVHLDVTTVAVKPGGADTHLYEYHPRCVCGWFAPGYTGKANAKLLFAEHMASAQSLGNAGRS